ncbi:hypothetical protein CYMTET_8403 [Cymbomonas tetramitiformis]|uniref:Uncharacterized protein n=1 Tax=Cymbomonas tetramitiformis TaxID=36881 RepID=A0AAE0GT38_9CHLO|nr:hypothetical protein CYMTET_55107 [Cymbomonas tetramitiformis]KAK3283915.1 hypothetical protein CYMTET_8403 [Cymbomonas tetramitiformis]
MVCLSPVGEVSVTQAYTHYSDEGRVLEAKHTVLFDVDVVSLVHIFLLTSASQHLVYALQYTFVPKSLVAHANEFGVFWVRWSDYVLTAPVMMVVVGIMNAIFDVVVLATLFGCIFATLGLGVLSDVLVATCIVSTQSNQTSRDNKALRVVHENPHDSVWLTYLLVCVWSVPPNILVIYFVTSRVPLYVITSTAIVTGYMCVVLRLSDNGCGTVRAFWSLQKEAACATAKVTFALACLPCVYAWAVVFGNFAATLYKSEENPPEFVYAINIVLLLLFLGPFPYIHYASIEEACRRISDESSKLYYETSHAMFGFVSKSALAWLVYWGIRRIQDDVDVVN